ncbi:MAG: hypothetical protein EBX72_00390, partial [Betaproteobacteria bacterium]|nr:hypothetical protein [Betaproteobacteria bacterium]
MQLAGATGMAFALLSTACAQVFAGLSLAGFLRQFFLIAALCLGLFSSPAFAQGRSAWAMQPTHQVEGMVSYRLPNGLELILYP